MCEVLRVEERLAAGEVDFAHAGGFEETEAALGVGEGEDVGGFGGVEAEAAGVVAFSGEVVVDGDGDCAAGA